MGVQYGMHEGTSQSAGFVAGAAALLLAAYRTAGINATGAMMKSPIMSGAQPLPQLKSRCKAGAALAPPPAVQLSRYCAHPVPCSVVWRQHAYHKLFQRADLLPGSARMGTPQVSELQFETCHLSRAVACRYVKGFAVC